MKRQAVRQKQGQRQRLQDPGEALNQELYKLIQELYKFIQELYKLRPVAVSHCPGEGTEACSHKQMGTEDQRVMKMEVLQKYVLEGTPRSTVLQGRT